MKALIGTKRLVRLALRRDRVTLPLVMLLAIAMVGGSAPALQSAYASYEEQIAYIASSAPSLIGRMFQGTVAGVNLGTILSAETFMFTSVILAIMSIFIVTRHTRHNEETGAGELIGSGIVGRSSTLTAAIIVAVLANVVTAVIIYLSLLSVPELDKTGSLFFSLSLMMTGIFFASVAAVTSQLSDFRRGANGLAIIVLVIAFIIRAFGDAIGDIAPDGLSVSASWVTWLSPLGWANQVLAYNENRILPLVLLVVASLGTFWVSYLLMKRRDIGSSIFQSRAGNARAPASLLGTHGLTRKIQRGSLLAWLTAYVLFGVMMGVVTNDFRETFEENEAFQQLLQASGGAGTYSEVVFASIIPITIAMLSAYLVSALSKTNEEENSGRLEYVLSTAMGRVAWLMSHVSYVVFGILACIAGFGIATAGAYVYSADTKETGFLDIFTASMINVPAMLLFMSVILLVFAVKGRFVRTFAWLAYAYIALIGSLAGIFDWPEWLVDVSPFSHTPPAPAADINTTPLIVMTAMALSIVLLSLYAFRHRDLNLN